MAYKKPAYPLLINFKVPPLVSLYYREVRVGTNINVLSTSSWNHVCVSTNEYFAK